MRVRITILVILLTMSCNSTNNYSGSLQIESNVDTTLARIGDIINFEVKSHFAENKIIDFPDIAETESMEIRSKQVFVKDNFASRVNFQIVFWDTGKFTIPEYPVNFLNSDSTLDFTIKTDSVSINVISMLTGTEDRNIRPIKDPVAIKEPINWHRWTMITILIVLILILIGLCRKRIKNPNLEKISVSEQQSAVDIAKSRLDELQKILPNDNKKYYLYLSFIIREFIENQFYVRSLEMTTKEIKSLEGEIGINIAEFRGMINILNRADLAKFAKYDFSVNDRQADLDWTKKFLSSFDEHSNSIE